MESPVWLPSSCVKRPAERATWRIEATEEGHQQDVACGM